MLQSMSRSTSCADSADTARVGLLGDAAAPAPAPVPLPSMPSSISSRSDAEPMLALCVPCAVAQGRTGGVKEQGGQWMQSQQDTDGEAMVKSVPRAPS